jgi:hypothetical protein
MKKKLLTVGDSFTYGDELDNPGIQAWPCQLAELLGYDVCNLGLSGASNTSIMRITLEELATNHYDLVIIGWTFPGRIEWKDQLEKHYNVWPGQVLEPDAWTEYPWRFDQIEYINRHHDSVYLYQMYLIHVISLQSYFRAHNIKYRMIDITHCNHYRDIGSKQHANLEAKVDTKYFIGWGEFGIHELASDSPRGPRHHPLEQGHKQIAVEIYQRLQ